MKRFCFLYLGLVYLLGMERADAQTLHTAGAIENHVQLETIDGRGWHFAGTTEDRVDQDQLVRWGSWPGILRAQGIWLRDGSWLCGEIGLSGDQLTVESVWLQCPPIAQSNVRGLVLTPPASLSAWIELWRQMLAVEGQQDVVWLGGNRRISGIVRRLESTGRQSSTRLTIDSNGRTVELDFDDIQAIVFSPALLGGVRPPAARLSVGLDDGALLLARETGTRDGRMTFLLESGIEVASLDAAREFSTGVTYVENHPSDTIFLSDLEPASYRHLGDSKLEWELGIDKDLLSRPLMTAGGTVHRGLATHSSSQVAYRWDGSAGRFLAEVVLAPPDPQANPRLGSVDCQVLLARGGKLELVQSFTLVRTSGERSTEASANVDVDVGDAQLVVLVTDQADFGQYGDHVLWLSARFAGP